MNVSLTLLVCQEVLLLDADNSIEHILVVPLGRGEEGRGGRGRNVRFGTVVIVQG